MMCSFLSTHRYKIVGALCFAVGFFGVRAGALYWKGPCSWQTPNILQEHRENLGNDSLDKQDNADQLDGESRQRLIDRMHDRSKKF